MVDAKELGGAPLLVVFEKWPVRAVSRCGLRSQAASGRWNPILALKTRKDGAPPVSPPAYQFNFASEIGAEAALAPEFLRRQ